MMNKTKKKEEKIFLKYNQRRRQKRGLDVIVVCQIVGHHLYVD